MKHVTRTLTALALCLLGAQAPVAAQNLLDHLPDDSLLVVYYPDVPGGTEALAASPVGQLLAGLDWSELVYTFAQIGQAEMGESQLSDQELRAETEKITERFHTMYRHLSGEVVFSIGNLSHYTEVMAETETLRAENRIDWSRNLEDQDLESIQKKNELLDQRESHAFARDVQLLAQVRDGDTLLDLLADWSREMVQEAEPGEDGLILNFAEKPSGNYRLFHLFPELPEDADDHMKALLEYDLSLHWTLVNDTMVVAMHEAALRDAIERLEQRPGNRLASSGAFLDASDFHGDYQMLIYANLPALGPLFRKILQDEGPVAPGEMAFEQLHDWLALDALVPLTFSSETRADAGTSRFRFGFSRETPLSRILMSTPAAPAPMASFVHKDIGSMTSGHFSLPLFYEALEAEVTALSPEAGAAFGLARMYAFGALGFDFKLQFLDHLGSGMTLIAESDPDITRQVAQAQLDEDFAEQMRLAEAHPTGGNHMMLAVELRNQAGISASINTLMNKLFDGNPPEPEDVLDHPVYFPLKNFPGIPGDLSENVSFTYLDDHLLISIAPPRMLMRAIEASRDPDLRLWNDPGFQEARRHTPAEAHGIDYTSAREFRTIFGNLHTAMNTLAASVGAPAGVFPNFEEMGELLEIGVGVTRRRDLVLEAETRLRLRQPE